MITDLMLSGYQVEHPIIKDEALVLKNQEYPYWWDFKKTPKNSGLKSVCEMWGRCFLFLLFGYKGQPDSERVNASIIHTQWHFIAEHVISILYQVDIKNIHTPCQTLECLLPLGQKWESVKSDLFPLSLRISNQAHQNENNHILTCHIIEKYLVMSECLME